MVDDRRAEAPTMKILVLHWHGICPHCDKESCIYTDFYRDEDGVKLPHGFRCDSCDSWISNEEFDAMKKINCPCPKEIIQKKE